MRNIFFLGLFSVLLSACELASGIFKAGYYTGLILVAIVIVLLLFLWSSLRKK